ncbi:MAG: CRISPR-associated helicase/endonuclease Cas3 [Silanimonas sp.]|nr:MAG: CRISPR-associated helicase/endonuclease Cas3 [Silanimonas sp.]
MYRGSRTYPQPWGKRREDGTSHPLADHCLDVAVTFRALLDTPGIARSLPPLDLVQRERLTVIAFLHDFGKCNRGFQAKADPSAKDTAGHVVEGLALLWDLCDLWPPGWKALLTDIAAWFKDAEQAMQMLLASLSHHGRPLSESDYQNSGVERTARTWWSTKEGYDPLAALDALAATVREAFPRAFQDEAAPIDAPPYLQQRFAGLVMLADWIGSDTQFFPYRQNADEDRLALARDAAQRALRSIGLTSPANRQPRPFQAIFGFQPSPLQAALTGEIAPGEDTRLLLAESDTGSGKTEAALAWFFRLYAEGKVDGLYFALPTRVAARELYGRVLKAMEAAFDDEHRPGPVLLAAPGYVQVDGQSIPALLTNPDGVLWDDSAQDRQRERLWSAERPKRFLAAPIAVGTIDQALLSVLQVKHSLLRSVCLDRHLLVVDEVHASDPYMREVLKALLRGHLARGGWALLLSATLGESSAAAYFGRDPAPLQDAIHRPYPLLSAHNKSWPMPSARHRVIDVECSPTLTDDAALLPALFTALQQGARVLVICNTVARANALFRQVEAVLERDHPALLSALFQEDGVRCPHHGRFARADRERLDFAITTQLGKGSPEGPKLLIGTQTLEQSLDIDADWLITDLAPMDVLIQRFGRLHRHDRARRPAGFMQPRVLLRIPERELDTYLTSDGALRGAAGLGSVYADGRVLALTLQSLQAQPQIELPAQARERIEHTTHPECLNKLPDPWPSHGAMIEGRELSEIRQALRSVLDAKPFGELHYPDKSERVLTRLGRPAFEIPLAAAARSPFGMAIDRVSVPAHWLDPKSVPEVVHAQPFAGGFYISIGETSLRYTRFGLEKLENPHARPAQ